MSRFRISWCDPMRDNYLTTYGTWETVGVFEDGGRTRPRRSDGSVVMARGFPQGAGACDVHVFERDEGDL
jgi:hypothetical protein